MAPRNILNIFRALALDPDGARRFRAAHTLPQERFALVFAAAIYALVAAGSFFTGGSTESGMYEIGGIIAVSTMFYLFRPRHFRDSFIHLYSSYYILLFLFVYYFPLLFGAATTDLRPGGTSYLLHLSLLIAQGLRPHVRGGAVVLLFLCLHSGLVLRLDPRPLDAADLLRFTLFAWLGIVVLYIERLNHLNSFKFFDLNWRKERERDDLKLAQQVHKNLFPGFQENERIRLFSRRISPGLMGGDFFDLVYLREGNLGLFFTDISGHGISAAMMSAAVKGIVTSAPYRNRMNPADLLTTVDRVMSEEYGSHHASAVYAYLDFQARVIRMANAGHPPMLRSTGGRPFHEIESEGVLLGYGLRRPIAEEIVLPLRAGDRLLFYSDGLLECRGLNSHTFIPSIEEFLDGLETLPADQVLDELLRRVRARREFGGFRDDVMLVLLETK